MNIGGLVKVEVDTTATAGTSLTSLTNGLTFTKLIDRGGDITINASGQIELSTAGNGGSSTQDVWVADYTPPVEDYFFYSTHPAGSTPNNQLSLSTLVQEDSVTGQLEFFSFRGQNNTWRQFRTTIAGTNDLLGIASGGDNPESEDVDIIVERLASSNITLAANNAQISGLNNEETLLANTAVRKVGIGAYGSSGGAYLTSFGVAWRQILYLDNYYPLTGQQVTVHAQGLGATQGTATVTLRENAAGTGNSVTQTITAWADDQTTFTAVQGTLTAGKCYLFIESDDGNVTTVGFELNIGVQQPGNPNFRVENLIPGTVETTNLSQMGTNNSGVAKFDNGELAFVDNSQVTMSIYDETDLDTRIEEVSFVLGNTEDDLEDITEVGNGLFGICVEDNSISQAFLCVHRALGQTSITPLSRYESILPGGDNNSGAEIIGYIPETNTLVVMREGQQANTTMAIALVKLPVTLFTDYDLEDSPGVPSAFATNNVTTPFDANTQFNGIVTDLSGGTYHPASKTFIAISDQSNKLIQFDPYGDGTVISEKDMPQAAQWEGFDILDGDDRAIAVAEQRITVTFTYPAAAAELTAGNTSFTVQSVSSAIAQTHLTIGQVNQIAIASNNSQIIQVQNLSSTPSTYSANSANTSVTQTHELLSTPSQVQAISESFGIGQVHELQAASTLIGLIALNGSLNQSSTLLADTLEILIQSLNDSINQTHQLVSQNQTISIDSVNGAVVVGSDLVFTVPANQIALSTQLGQVLQTHQLSSDDIALSVESVRGPIAQTSELVGKDFQLALNFVSGAVEIIPGVNLSVADTQVSITKVNGQIIQQHELVSADSELLVISDNNAISQSHDLLAVDQQILTSSVSGAVFQGVVHSLTANNRLLTVAQDNRALSQSHVLTNSNSLLGLVAANESISQSHELAGGNTQIILASVNGAYFELAMIDIVPRRLVAKDTTNHFHLKASSSDFIIRSSTNYFQMG